MAGEEASVPSADGSSPTTGGAPATAETPAPTIGYGWDAEIDETDFGESNELEGQPTSIEDNSPDIVPEEPPPVAAPEVAPAPAVPTLGPATPPAPPTPAPQPVAPAPPAPERSPYALPHDDSPVVREWTAHVLSLPLEQRQQALRDAPGGVGAQVTERVLALSKAHQRFQADPASFIGELAEQRAADLMEQSAFAKRFRQIEAIVLGQAGEQFLAKHKIVAPAEVAQFNALAGKVGAQEAAEIVALRRRVAELEGTKAKVATSQREIEAIKANARAQQSGKGKSRATDLVGQRQKELDAAGTNPIKIFQINEKYEKAGLPPGRLKRES